MTPDAVPPSPGASSPPGRLRIEVPASTRFLPVLESAVRIYLRFLSGPSAPFGHGIERRLAQAFRAAARRSSTAVSVELAYAAPTLEASITPAGGKAVVLRFTRDQM